MDVGAMALRPRGGERPLFSQRWVDGLAKAAGTWMPCEIEVYALNGEPVRDPVFDTWTETTTTHYTGKARVQPVRSSREVQNTGDPTTTQRVRFQVPVGDWGLLPDQRVTVTSATLNPALERSQFVVVEITDSSNPFETTFECTTNLETVR